jgi:hypothetical protein
MSATNANSAIPKSPCLNNCARPDRLVEGCEEQANNCGIDSGESGLCASATALTIPDMRLRWASDGRQLPIHAPCIHRRQIRCHHLQITNSDQHLLGVVT